MENQPYLSNWIPSLKWNLTQLCESALGFVFHPFNQPIFYKGLLFIERDSSPKCTTDFFLFSSEVKGGSCDCGASVFIESRLSSQGKKWGRNTLSTSVSSCPLICLCLDYCNSLLTGTLVFFFPPYICSQCGSQIDPSKREVRPYQFSPKTPAVLFPFQLEGVSKVLPTV